LRLRRVAAPRGRAGAMLDILWTILTATREGRRLLATLAAALVARRLAGRVTQIAPFSKAIPLLLCTAVYGRLYDMKRWPSYDRIDPAHLDLYRRTTKRFWKRYPARVEVQGKLNKGERYFFAMHPHGAMSIMPPFFHGGSDELEAVSPIETRRMLSAAVFLKPPIFREMVMSVGFMDATKENVRGAAKAGLSLQVLPGGEREMLLTRKDRQAVYVGHKGFVRLAIETGLPIVPVYCFGETSTHNISRLFLKQRLWLSRRFRIAIPFAYGDGSVLQRLNPIDVPLTSVVGEPIRVEQHPAPVPDELVDKVHYQYVMGLKKVFDDNKHRLGYGDKELEIYSFEGQVDEELDQMAQETEDESKVRTSAQHHHDGEPEISFPMEPLKAKL